MASPLHWLALLLLPALAGEPGEAAFAEGVKRAVAGDPGAAAPLFEEACRKGHARACANLATLLERGAGVRGDVVRAAQLHRQACEADLALSCDALGTLTTNGLGVPADDAAALALYRKACALGHGPGCTHAGVMLDGGFGTGRSWQEARQAYATGCRAGDAQGCWSLGQRLLGLRRPEATAEAMEHIERACTLEVAEACAAAASVYAGAAGDRARARSLAARACELGHQESCR